MRLRPGFCLVAQLAFIVVTKSALAENLDLSDCATLMRKPPLPEVTRLLREMKTAASRGDTAAERNLAAIASNRFACIEQAGTDNEGWTMVMESAGTVETSRALGIQDIGEKPEALAALKDAIARTHAVGARDPGFRTISAELTGRYAHAVPQLVDQAYEDVAGAYAFDCVLKRPYGRRDSKSACQHDRAIKSQLFMSVSSERRVELDQNGLDWAKNVVTPAAR